MMLISGPKLKYCLVLVGSGRPMASSFLIWASSPSRRALARWRSNCVLTLAAQLETWPVPT